MSQSHFTSNGGPRRFITCGKCYRRGVIRVGVKYVPCPNGCYPDSWGTKKLTQQAALEARMASLKAGGSW